MNQKMHLMAGALLLSLLTAACTPSDDGPKPASINPPVVKKVTQENYLSGRQFCATYSSITQKEYGKRVTVPMDYSNPSKGELSIYAYTMRPFDPSKPSYIFVDGGPGQNTHGLMPEYLDGSFNEIRFDQRGLGCSAPESWEIYKDVSLYSSMNNIRDMEMIRKAYGIQKWSVYGVSYGTVPSTMYGSVFPDSTAAVVLEGVVGRLEMTHMMSYKAEKMNLVLAELNSAQRATFSDLMRKNTPDRDTILGIFFQLFYSDVGMRTQVKLLNRLIEPSGILRSDLISNLRARMTQAENKYPSPQQPGAVDSNILTIIYCKNLGSRQKPNVDLNYSPTQGFYTETISDGNSRNSDCDEAGVKVSDEDPYILENFRTNRPVYYFQGSHDGATLAIGALAHFQTVPQGQTYFLLAQKGGHNPNLTRLEGDDWTIKAEQKALLKKAMSAVAITDADLVRINDREDDADPAQKWILYTNPHAADLHMEDEFKGIKRAL